jgi:hypothetical protein
MTVQLDQKPRSMTSDRESSVKHVMCCELQRHWKQEVTEMETKDFLKIYVYTKKGLCNAHPSLRRGHLAIFEYIS